MVETKPRTIRIVDIRYTNTGARWIVEDTVTGEQFRWNPANAFVAFKDGELAGGIWETKKIGSYPIITFKGIEGN